MPPNILLFHIVLDILVIKAKINSKNNFIKRINKITTDNVILKYQCFEQEILLLGLFSLGALEYLKINI